MNNFMKMVGATIVGLLLWSIVMFVFCIVGMAGVVASEGTASIEDGSILHINLNGELKERAGAELPAFLNNGNQTLALDQLLEAIDKAAKSKKVEGIFLEGGVFAATPAMQQELRQALVRFKKDSKKWIVAYGEQYSQSSYYVCSVADSLFINPEGMIDWHGMASQPIFFTDVMKKLGVKMQVFKVGTFKSAVEPFINTEMSEPNREQVTSYLTSIWGNVTKEVAASRKISVEQLNALADQNQSLVPTPIYLKDKLVDGLMYRDEIRDMLKNKVKCDEDDRLELVAPAVMARTESFLEKKDDCIAVMYAYGDIVNDGGSANPMSSASETIAPAPFNTEMEKLMNDDDIKAVVIRVNSGGGSAYASEQLWRQITRVKEKKPVVISMGGMAASGGYYMSCNASRIVAEPTTLTGSIGIFGMIPDASELATDKVGLHFDMVKTNEHADFGTMARPFNESEASMMQAYVERGYELFTSRVAEGRGISQDSVKVIGEGRVWTGEQALKLGLVDELGDLQAAIKAAAKLAKTKDYVVDHYPAEKSFFEKLMEESTDGPDLINTQLKYTLGEWYEPVMMVKNLQYMDRIQARMMPIIIK